MALTPPPLKERRKFVRGEPPSRFAINLLQPHRAVAASYLNFSEGGLCLRLQEMLEVRSLVRLQLTPEGGRSMRSVRPVECTGRVAWVIQRLDLRGMPPFLFDVGIEFVDPPRDFRHFLVQQGGSLAVPNGRLASEKSLEPSLIHGRRFVPRLERGPVPSRRWHLVVSVDGLPCFSGHYASQREAMTAWASFKRQQAKR